MIYLKIIREAILLGLQAIHKFIAYRMRDCAIWLIHHSEPVLEAESELVYIIIGPVIETDSVEEGQEARS